MCASLGASDQAIEILLYDGDKGVERRDATVRCYVQIENNQVVRAKAMVDRPTLIDDKNPTNKQLFFEVDAKSLNISSGDVNGDLAISSSSETSMSYAIDLRPGKWGWQGTWEEGGRDGYAEAHVIPSLTERNQAIAGFIEMPIGGGNYPLLFISQVFGTNDVVYRFGSPEFGTERGRKISSAEEEQVPFGHMAFFTANKGISKSTGDSEEADHYSLQFDADLDAEVKFPGRKRLIIKGAYNVQLKGQYFGELVLGNATLTKTDGEETHQSRFILQAVPVAEQLSIPSAVGPGEPSSQLADLAKQETLSPIRPGVESLDVVIPGLSEEIKFQLDGKTKRRHEIVPAAPWRTFYQGSFIHDPAPADGDRRAHYAGPYFQPINDVHARAEAHATAVLASRYLSGLRFPLVSLYLRGGSRKGGPNAAHMHASVIKNALVMLQSTQDKQKHARALAVLRNGQEAAIRARGGTWGLPGMWYKTLSWIPLYSGESLLDIYEQQPSPRLAQALKLFAAGIVNFQRESGAFTWAGFSAPETDGAHKGWLGHPPRGRGRYQNAPDKGDAPGWKQYVALKEFAPGDFLHFLGRYRTLTGDASFVDYERKAYTYELAVTAKAMMWNARSHNPSPSAFEPYVPSFLALYLTKYALPDLQTDSERQALAMDIARLIEDRRVHWDAAPLHAVSDQEHPKDRSGPSVALSARLGEIFARLGQETNNPLAQAKGKTLLKSVLASQNPDTGHIRWNYENVSYVSDGISNYHDKEGDAVLRVIEMKEILAQP